MSADTTDLNLPEFQPFRARISRTATLFTEINRAWADYLEQRPHTFTTEVDDEGRGTLRVHRRIPIPDELPLVVGEFVYQLRAALDNCLYAVAIIDSGQNPPPNAELLQWPIYTKPSDWTKNRRRFAHLSDELVEALEAIQPYNAEYPDWNCLRLLHDLARVDRHRTLHLVALYPALAKVWHDRHLVHDIEIHPGVISDGDVLMTFRYTGDEPIGRDHIDGNFEFDLELADVEETRGPDGTVSRPYGSLEKRLRAMYDVTQDYMLQLAWTAQNPDE